MRVVGYLVEFGKLSVGTSQCILVDIKATLATVDATKTCETWPAGTWSTDRGQTTSTNAWKSRVFRFGSSSGTDYLE